MATKYVANVLLFYILLNYLIISNKCSGEIPKNNLLMQKEE